MRGIEGRTSTDTLARVLDPGQTTFVDSSTPPGQHGRLHVDIADTVLVSEAREARLELPAVTGVTVATDAAAATGTIRWTAYAGPRFKAYRVVRGTRVNSASLGAPITQVATTAYVDSHLAGNTEYSDRGRHRPWRGDDERRRRRRDPPGVASWDLDLEEWEVVRLAAEADGTLSALIAGPRRVRLQLFDTVGNLLEKQVFYTTHVDCQGPDLIPQKVASAVDIHGRRLLQLSRAHVTWVQAQAADGTLLRTTYDPFADVENAARQPGRGHDHDGADRVEGGR